MYTTLGIVLFCIASSLVCISARRLPILSDLFLCQQGGGGGGVRVEKPIYVTGDRW